jgi:predicted TIM-barrel enzyme
MNVGARFIRVGLLTGVAISESGLLEGKYRDLAAYRKWLQEDRVAVFADVSLSRTAPLTTAHQGEPLTLVSLAQQAVETGSADGIILTDPLLTPPVIADVRNTLDVPVMFDYPHAISQVAPYLQASDGLVVAAPLKKTPSIGGDPWPTVDLIKIEEMAALADLTRISPSPV